MSGSFTHWAQEKIPARLRPVAVGVFHALRRARPDERALLKMVRRGEVAIIPAGFRCYTRAYMRRNWSVWAASMPFDSGFFPPSSVASVIRDPSIDLKYPDDGTTHAVCIRYMNHKDPRYGVGIKFVTSSYEEIRSLATSEDVEGIGDYLDGTYSYYTLDKRHGYVLAHYNWHEFADRSHSHGVSDPAINIPAINTILSRRLERMFEACRAAKYVFFVVHEQDGFDFMMVDDERYDLHEYGELTEAVASAFDARTFVVRATDMHGAADMLAMMAQ